jgi:hypothetical protein
VFEWKSREQRRRWPAKKSGAAAEKLPPGIKNKGLRMMLAKKSKVCRFFNRTPYTFEYRYSIIIILEVMKLIFITEHVPTDHLKYQLDSSLSELHFEGFQWGLCV